jgi:DNA-binding XRE family transcriptional regulator
MARAISKSGMTQEALANAIGMRRTAIQHWLNEVDDCLVSQVYETADAIGMKVKIKIEPK